MAELLRVLTLAFVNIKLVLVKQQTLQQAVDNFVREFTLGDIPGKLDALALQLDDVHYAVYRGPENTLNTWNKITELRDYITTQDSGLLAAIGNVGDSIPSDLAEQLAAILDAIGSIPAPPTPPSVGEIAGGVWDAIDPFSRDHATAYGAEQASPWDWTDLLKAAGSVPAKHSPFFNVSYPPPIPD